MASSSADIFADPYDAQDVRDDEEGHEVASVTEEEVEEEEDDSMDEHFDFGKLSPRKKRRSRGGSAARSRGKIAPSVSRFTVNNKLTRKPQNSQGARFLFQNRFLCRRQSPLVPRTSLQVRRRG